MAHKIHYYHDSDAKIVQSWSPEASSVLCCVLVTSPHHSVNVSLLYGQDCVHTKTRVYVHTYILSFHVSTY